MLSSAVQPIILGSWPTPVEPLARCAQALGLGPEDLWIKRDDVTGLGGGGNKIRKLQYTCAQALAVGATTLITTGAPQSNHARLTASAAARLGLRCVLVLGGAEPESAQGNLVLDALAGAEIVWAGGDTASAVDAAAEAIAESGGVPFVIPFGGTSAVAAQGYVDCAREIEQQLAGLDRVVVALGSGGTMAGLVAHLGVDRVVGVDVGAVADRCRLSLGCWTRCLVRPCEPQIFRSCETKLDKDIRRSRMHQPARSDVWLVLRASSSTRRTPAEPLRD